jgi:hypothetical protein
VAKGSTEPVLRASLTELALEHSARAVAIEAQALGKDRGEDG